MLETSSTTLELKFASDAGTGEFEGFGAFFENVDAYGDVLMPGAFAATLAERKAAGRGLPLMHLEHGLAELGGERAIGTWLAMSEEPKGLHVKGRLAGMDTERGRWIHARVRDGAIGGLSIGFSVRPNGADFVRTADGRRRTLKAVNLAEVSLVAEPANAFAVVDHVKLGGIGDLEDLLRRGGLSKAAARTIATGGWPALSDQPHDDTPAFDMKALNRALARNLTELKGLR